MKLQPVHAHSLKVESMNINAVTLSELQPVHAHSLKVVQNKAFGARIVLQPVHAHSLKVTELNNNTTKDKVATRTCTQLESNAVIYSIYFPVEVATRTYVRLES